jgi:hypothetical protein
MPKTTPTAMEKVTGCCTPDFPQLGSAVHHDLHEVFAALAPDGAERNGEHLPRLELGADTRGHLGTQPDLAGRRDLDGDHVLHHVVLDGGLWVDGRDLALEVVGGKCIHREYHALANPDLPDVDFVHAGFDLQPSEIDDGDKRRGIQAGGNGFAFLRGDRRDDSGEGRGDERIGQLDLRVGESRPVSIPLCLGLLGEDLRR